ncbi:hypothetical protein Tco_0622509 [Tanacetum coccineum]
MRQHLVVLNQYMFRNSSISSIKKITPPKGSERWRASIEYKVRRRSGIATFKSQALLNICSQAMSITVYFGHLFTVNTIKALPSSKKGLPKISGTRGSQDEITRPQNRQGKKNDPTFPKTSSAMPVGVEIVSASIMWSGAGVWVFSIDNQGSIQPFLSAQQHRMKTCWGRRALTHFLKQWPLLS